MRIPAAVLLGVLTCAACGSSAECHSAAPKAGSCHDLTLEHRSFDEWRVIHPPAVLQEVGDAYYPACQKAGTCGGDPLGGKEATDVWKYDDVDPAKAVIGLRQDTNTYVVFVRTGVDPRTLGP